MQRSERLRSNPFDLIDESDAAEDAADSSATSDEAPEFTGNKKPTRSQRRRELQRQLPSILMDIDEAAAYLRCSTQSVYDDCKAEPPALPIYRRGKRVYVVKPLVDEMILREARKSWDQE